MELQNYLTEQKELLDNFHQFIQEENDSEEDFLNLISYIKTKKYDENLEEFKLILYIINDISNNHHRYPTFFDKIEKIITYFSEQIKQNFPNYELFNIFQNNKKILYLLFQNKIILVDSNIANLILNKCNIFTKYQINYFNSDKISFNKYFEHKIKNTKNYDHYFFPDIKPFVYKGNLTQIEKYLLQQSENSFQKFEYNRKIGENDSYICILIRQDSIKEFIIYVNKNNLSLSSEVPDSIFETNPFLMKKPATIIQYAAFFGSIQIFKYLQLNQVKLEPSLWLYAIHSNNPEIIQILVENKIKPNDQSYLECFLESIKCHHNDIANYIKDNFISNEVKVDKNNFISNHVAFGFHYHNYEFVQNFKDYQFIFYYSCLYYDISIVKILLSTKAIDLNQQIILT